MIDLLAEQKARTSWTIRHPHIQTNGREAYLLQACQQEQVVNGHTNEASEGVADNRILPHSTESQVVRAAQLLAI